GGEIGGGLWHAFGSGQVGREREQRCHIGRLVEVDGLQHAVHGSTDCGAAAPPGARHRRGDVIGGRNRRVGCLERIVVLAAEPSGRQRGRRVGHRKQRGVLGQATGARGGGDRGRGRRRRGAQRE